MLFVLHEMVMKMQDESSDIKNPQWSVLDGKREEKQPRSWLRLILTAAEEFCVMKTGHFFPQKAADSVCCLHGVPVTHLLIVFKASVV